MDPPKREKNPNRVEQGKKLAAWNKENRGKMKLLEEEVKQYKEKLERLKQECEVYLQNKEEFEIYLQNKEEFEIFLQDREEIELLKKEIEILNSK